MPSLRALSLSGGRSPESPGDPADDVRFGGWNVTGDLGQVGAADRGPGGRLGAIGAADYAHACSGQKPHLLILPELPSPPSLLIP
jgi:hypothetical protein